MKLALFCILSTVALSGCIVHDDVNAEDLNTQKSGLELYLDFDNKSAEDKSGNSYDGILGGSRFVTNTPNGGGYAYNIVEKDDILRIPYNPFGESSEYSICMWLRDPSQGVILSTYGNNTNSSHSNFPSIRIDNNKFFAGFDFYSTDDYFEYDPNLTLQDGNWHHVAITVIDENQKLYIDGQLMATQQASVELSKSSEVHISGTLDSCTGSYMKIDNIRLYSRAITKGEVELIIEAEQ